MWGREKRGEGRQGSTRSEGERIYVLSLSPACKDIRDKVKNLPYLYSGLSQRVAPSIL
jgi:hypothetical protein